VGFIGEVVAAKALGLTLHRASYPGHDAFDKNGDVQIKMTGGKSVALNATCDRLVILRVISPEFRAMSAMAEKRQQWFGEADELAAAERGLSPNALQCIAFKTPLVFAESGMPEDVYVADLYEQVSFLGDLQRQISGLADGTKVRMNVKKS
jgi:hypothetical protein